MFEKIMCPVDLSPKSAAAVKKAVELARLFGSSLTLLNVHEEFMSRQEMHMLRVSEQHFEELQKERAVASREAMQAMVADANADGVDIQCLLREGKPASEIVETADELGMDLIVMATDGRSKVGEWLLGSNAEKVVRRATCSVLTLPIGE